MAVTTEPHAEIFEFAQRAQALALVLLEPDSVRRLSGVWDVLSQIPHCDRDDDRVVLSMILRRLAEALVQAECSRELSPAERLRRARISDVHCSRVLVSISREFANPGLDLRTVANQCRLTAPYVSHLLSVTTGHGFHAHLSWIRILHAVRLLVSTPLSIEEVADKSGFKSASVLDHDFKKRFHMTPSELRRWA
jgi:AraC-like DNA-binding protein